MWLPIGSLYNDSSTEEIKHAFNVFFVGSSKSATHVYGMVSYNLSPCPSIYSKRVCQALVKNYVKYSGNVAVLNS